ncbi:MAG: DNA repair exonuclease [Firmicutes bacterium]|nr:DNA repair exonuclease [Bacillota bacterium]
MIRMLHLADLHLGYKPTFLDEERAVIRQKERDQLLKKAVDFALDPAQGIDMVFIVGDLFETHRPEEGLVRFAIEQLRRLTTAGIYLVTVPGNHDEISYLDSVYRLKKEEWPGVLVEAPMPELIDSQEIKGCRVWVYSLAYTGGLTKTDALNDFPRKAGEGLHIGAFHGTLDWNPGERSLPLKSTALAKAAYSYLALGHLHSFQEHKVGSTPAVYPGAVENKSLTERGVGHFTVVNFTEGKVSLEKPGVTIREHREVKLDLSTLQSQEEIVAACRRHRDPEKLVEFCLTGAAEFPIDVQGITGELQADFFYLRVRDESSFVDWSQIERYTDEHTVRGAFVRRILARMEQAGEARQKEVLRMALLKGLAVFQRGD